MSGLSIVTRATSLGLLHHKNEEDRDLLILDRECISLRGRLEPVPGSGNFTIPHWCFLYLSVVTSLLPRSTVLYLKGLKSVLATMRCSFGLLGKAECKPDLL